MSWKPLHSNVDPNASGISGAVSFVAAAIMARISGDPPPDSFVREESFIFFGLPGVPGGVLESLFLTCVMLSEIDDLVIVGWKCEL